MAISRIATLGCFLAGALATNSTPTPTLAPCKGPGAGDCSECVNEIDTAADYHAIKDTLDLVIDVRTFFEYTGEKNPSEKQCSATTSSSLASMPEQKCQMGHLPSMWHAVNPDREDKAVMYKVDGSYTLDVKFIKALKDCYGDKANNMKIAISCYSGYRSRVMQLAMKKAGFTCGNIYNVRVGAQGLWAHNSSMFVKGYESKGPWSCPAPANTTASSTAGAANTSASSTAAGAATGASTEASSNAIALRSLSTLAALLGLWMQN